MTAKNGDEAGKAPLLQVKGVTKHFGGSYLLGKRPLVALDSVWISIAEDQPSITAIAGESGSGKTTLARILLGIASPTVGSVYYHGKDVRKMGRSERRQFRIDVQPIFQDPFESYNPFYKIDHVLRTPVRNFKLGKSNAEVSQRVEEALRLVGLNPAETLGRFPHQLSGGQRQRVMVARALLLRPRIILADEPVSMVDASLRATILDSIHRLNRELGISVIYITHDLTTAYQISDNIVVLYQGAVVEAGSVELVIKRPLHPYTQLLVQSIPQPDPNQTWGDIPVRGDTDRSSANGGCKFADRCPYVMDVCKSEAPPLFQPEAHRVVSCFLVKDAPRAATPDVAGAFAPPAAAR